jgi:anti-sigma B factor antagonist
MRITRELRKDAVILRMKGGLRMGIGDVLLRNEIAECISLPEQPAIIVLDMKDVTTIDSSGLGELVSAYTTCTNRGSKLMLVAISAKVTDVLKITQLITIFDIFASADEALRSCAA